MEAHERIARRMSALEAARQPWEGEWRQCADLTYPERGYGYEGSQTSQSNEAVAKTADIFDDTAKDGCRVMASAFVAGMVPANSKWLDLDVGTENDVEMRWLSDASQFLFDNIHGSNFDSVAFDCCLDMVSVSGSFVMYIDEAPSGAFHFEQWPAGQCYWWASTAGGPIDGICRKFEQTIEQTVHEYGIDKVSEKTREAFLAGKLDDKVQIVWAIEPTGKKGLLRRNKPWSSTHLELDGKHICRESGYDEFPCVVPRFMAIPGSHYAKGPMSTVLATVKTLNELQKLEVINLEMAAYGMYKATDDGVLNPFTTKIGPRRIVVVGDMKNFDVVKPSGDFRLSFAKKEELQAQVRRLLLADQLTPQDGPAMTATEVHARTMLIRQQLGPAFGRLTFEWLTRLVFRCFGIAYRAGVLEDECGPIPETLATRILNVKYSSPLARAQKLEEVTAANQWFLGLAEVAKAKNDVTVFDQVNVEEMAAFSARALGVPGKIVATEDEIKAKQQARLDAQKQAQQAQVQANVQEAAGVSAAENLMAA